MPDWAQPADVFVPLPVLNASAAGYDPSVSPRPAGELGARADGRAVLRHRQRENVSLVEDLSDRRAVILRRYLALAPGARPFFPVDRGAPLTDFERIVDQYPVFRVA